MTVETSNKFDTQPSRYFLFLELLAILGLLLVDVAWATNTGLEFRDYSTVLVAVVAMLSIWAVYYVYGRSQRLSEMGYSQPCG